MSFTKGTQQTMVLIDIDLDDDVALLAAADKLNTTPEAIRKMVDFSRQLIANAHRQELAPNELATTLMSVMSMLGSGVDSEYSMCQSA